VVPRHRRSQAISIMFSGLTLANVLGVPAGTALGQAFGWRASFWAIVPIGLIAGAAILWLVPEQPASDNRLMHEFMILKRPQVLLVLAMSTMSSASLFCVFTYVAPTLETITRISPHAVTVVLLLFGVGITVGNLLGGWLSDWKQMPAIIGALLVLLVALVTLFFAEQFFIPAVATILMWGLLQFAAGAPLQARVVDQAHGAPNLASTLNQGAFNLGNALGASLGGLMTSAGFGYRNLPWGSFCVTIVAIGLALLSARLDQREVRLTEVAEEVA
jgi:MFS transporter, DHA1 family, inner membrane transport protein